MADYEEDVVVAACTTIITASLGAVAAISELESRKGKHKVWVKKYIIEREKFGTFNCLLPEIASHQKYFTYLRMDVHTFEELFTLVEPEIARRSTRMRKPIPAREVFAATLRILATGESFRSIHFQFRHGETTVWRYFRRVCKAIYKVLHVTYMKMPQTKDDWNAIAEDFFQLWNFPNCLGAIDGKLVHIQRPIECGGQYFNYKRSFSVNMMAVVEARYRFLYVTVGAQGSANDASVFSESKFGKGLQDHSNPLAIPSNRLIAGTDIETPMMFVGDEAYPLRPYLMKPFSSRGLTASERVFNYRLSRARRVVEDAFGILVNRFRILRGNMQIQPPVVCDVVMACCALHNFLSPRQKDQCVILDNDMEPIAQQDQLIHVRNVLHEPRLIGSSYNKSAKLTHDNLAKYFVEQGQVLFQWKHANIVVGDN